MLTGLDEDGELYAGGAEIDEDETVAEGAEADAVPVEE